MSKSMLVGAVLGAVGVTTGGVVTTYSLVDRGPDYAEVVAIQPAKEAAKMPRQVYEDMAVIRQRPVKDQHQVAGIAIGAVVDGLLGSQIGGGTGRKIATVVDAAGGGHTGSKVQRGIQERDTYTTTEARCSTVHDSSEKIVGYDVKYMLGGKAGQARMERDSGN